MSFSGMIGSVEKVPLVEFQLYFLIFKPEFTWICTDLSMDLIDNIPIDPVGMKVSLVLGHLPALGRVSKPIS